MNCQLATESGRMAIHTRGGAATLKRRMDLARIRVQGRDVLGAGSQDHGSGRP